MLRIRLAGELRLCLDDRPLEPIASVRARSLLAWLAYHPGLHPRSRVASVFWPDGLDTSARASLRTTLAVVRRALPAEAADALVAGRERIGLEDVWVDVRESVRREAADDPEGALALLDGELLADLGDEWVLVARQAQRDRAVALHAAAGERAAAAGDNDAALRHARRRLDLDPVSEDAARVLMRRLAAAGDAAAAVAAYETFRTSLRRELGMAPSAATRALADELRSPSGADTAGGGAAAGGADAAHGGGGASGAETAAAHAAGTGSDAAGERAAVGGAEAASGGAATAGADTGRAGASAALPDALARPEHAPLVGRDEQLRALRAAWARAGAGAAAVVTLEGAAGSGKTRLLSELGAELHDAGATVLAGRCREDGAVAFAPFTEALRPYAAAAGAALPDWVAGELARLLPELAPDAAAPEGVPQDARHRLLEAVAAVVGQAAREAPVLLVVEDLHWADPATLQMLAHVVWTVGWAPVLVAGSIRDEDAGAPALQDLLAELARARRITRIPVGGLAEAEVAQLAGAWLGAGTAAELAQVVHARTGGNPLFVEEVVRHLAETHPGASGAALAAAAGSDVPAGVRAVIDRRLARLPELAGAAVRVGAVAGEDFALADVASACETSDVEVAEALETVVATGLVDATAAGRYRFAHALVRGAVLAWAGPTRRALAHRQLADVIATLPEERREPRVGELARHLLDARPLAEPDEAARWALHAAAQALRGLAYEDAAAVLARAADAELDPALRAEVLLALGDAQLRAGDAAAAQGSHRAAAEAARALGAPELLARAALGAAGLTVSVSPIRPEVRALLDEALAAAPEDAELRPVLLARLAIELYYEAPVTVREELSAAALAGGRRRGGRALLEALNARHVALWNPAHTEERLAIADELIDAATAAGDREAQLQGVNWRVADLLELGEMEALRAAVADHERLAEALRLPGYLWYGPLWHAMLALLGDRPEEAARHREVGHDLAVRAQDANGELLFTTQRLGIASAQGRLDAEDEATIQRRLRDSPAYGAWLVALALRAHQTGDPAGTAAALRRGVALVPAMPLDANWLYTMTGLGAIAARLGDAPAAAAIYPRLLPYGGRIVSIARGSYCTGSAWLALGLLALTLGERETAVAHLEAAVARNDAIGAGFHAAAARGALAQVATPHAAPPDAAYERLLWRL